MTSGWRSEFAYRLRELFWLKLIGTTLWTWLFFVGYFALLRRPDLAPSVMPFTALDQMVPFQPAMLWPYLSLWFYVGIAPGLQRGLAPLLAYGAWAGALLAAGLVLFYLWPTAVPALGIARTEHPGFAMLEGVDASGNACPSMHVAIAVFSALRLHAVLRGIAAPRAFMLANVVWCALIAWSTMAVRQHVVLDVAAGAVLGLAFALASLRWRPGRRALQPPRSGYHQPGSYDHAP